MTEQQLAELTLTMICNDGLSIPSSSAAKVVECQEWLRELAKPKKEKLKDVSKT